MILTNCCVQIWSLKYRSYAASTKLPYVLLKALPPVCMKYTARGESRVANICSTRQSRVLYLSRGSHQVLYISDKRSGSTLSGLLYFPLP